MRKIVVAAIIFYQRTLSPLKGFSCAYRVHRGGASCSAHGARVVGRHGVITGYRLIRRRLALCSDVHHAHVAIHVAHRAAWHRYQSGYCDLPCDGCDVSNMPCDNFNCLDALSCNFPTGRKKK